MRFIQRGRLQVTLTIRKINIVIKRSTMRIYSRLKLKRKREKERGRKEKGCVMCILRKE